MFTGPVRVQPGCSASRSARWREVLETRLRESLREDLGGTYSVSASAGLLEDSRARSTPITIAFGCSPDRTDELVKGVFKEIEQLKTNGPTDKQVADVKETFLRDQETNMKQNGYLLAQIAAAVSVWRGSHEPLQPWRTTTTRSMRRRSKTPRGFI